MGAPIIIDGCFDLWVSNGAKDFFCEVVVAAAKLEGIDPSEVYETAPGIAGTYGVSGLGINVNDFYPYFGGRGGFRQHLDVCCNRLAEVCETEIGKANMAHILAWAKFIMDGGKIGENQDFWETLPPTE